MTNKNHPVDEIFSKGLAGYKVNPSMNAKKKLFAAPEAIQPEKPWYMASKYLYVVTSVVLITSVLTYFIFFQNNSASSDLTSENTLINNISIKYNKSHNNPHFISSELSNQPAINKNTEQVNSSDETHPQQVTDQQNDNNALTSHTANPIETPVKKNNTAAKKEETITNTIAASNLLSENKVVKKTELNENTQTLIIEANANQFSESHISASFSLVSNVISDDRTSIDFIETLKPELHNLNNTSDIIFQAKKEADYVVKGFWFAEFKAGSFISNYKVTARESEWDKAVAAKQNLLQASPGNDYQLNVVYQKKNLLFKAGLSYVSYGEKLSGNVLFTNPQNQTQITFNNNAPYDIIIGGNYFNIDTLGGYYHYTYTQTSHIFISDSTWEWNTQNTPADVYDTTQYTKFDTLPENTFYNNIRYIEIPLSIGFVKPYGKFSIGISACVSPGLFIAVKGSDMNIDHYPALEPYKKNTLQKFMISAGANLEIGYQINEKLMLSIEPFYKKSLFKLYNESNKINQYFGSYGFRIGIRKLL